MAIRQEEYQIWRRANFKVKGNLLIYVEKGADFYMVDPLANPDLDCKQKKIEFEKDVEDTGIWELVFSSSSIEKTRAKYKEFLQGIGQAYLRVEKKIPKDILVTPYE